jgi:hypothetical protein
MSIAAMNWALSQRLETHQQQILLYVIADSADPSGVTRHCDPDYMVDRTRLSRATMFRRLAELEEIGALSRRKYYTESGMPRYEIRLNLEVRIDVPIRTRKSGDDEASPDGEEEAAIRPESQPETLVGPESHSETLVADTKVSPVRLPQSHSCDYISPPMSEGLPPNPPPGGVRSKKEVEQSERREAVWGLFKASYPGIASMDQQEARAELDELSIEDAEWAVSVCSAYDAERRKLRKQPKNAHIWLRKGMFRNYPKVEIRAPPSEGLWIAEGSDEDLALNFIRRLVRLPSRFVRTVDGVRGYWHKFGVGPDLIAMLTFAKDVPLRWPKVERGTAHYAAWQRRFEEWIGQPAPLEPGATALHVPTPWPPKKDGTIYADNGYPDNDLDQEGSAA